MPSLTFGCLLVASCGLADKKTYFTCAGQMTEAGSQPAKVTAATLSLVAVNDIPTALGDKPKHGYMILSDDVVSGFQFTQFTDQILLLSGDPGDPPAAGSFDLASRHLIANSKKIDYDLVCRETQLAPI
jgi:hypothetical protein